MKTSTATFMGALAAFSLIAHLEEIIVINPQMTRRGIVTQGKAMKLTKTAYRIPSREEMTATTNGTATRA
ncbi:MAG: hypothetical protein LBF40_00465 [Deltaproteobacteria bacterium]|nr:hypothetical protein [Deltaproteobacteria bacterium]